MLVAKGNVTTFERNASGISIATTELIVNANVGGVFHLCNRKQPIGVFSIKHIKYTDNWHVFKENCDRQTNVTTSFMVKNISSGN